jgi:uncharacterized membrane protein YeaQ/YmgE (transglycosylase-associated protein family)
MSLYFFTIGLIYILIGFGVTLVFYYVFKKSFLGSFWSGAIVGIVGSFTGGFIDHFFKNIISLLSNLFGAINIFPPLFTAIFFLWLFHVLTKTSSDD